MFALTANVTDLDLSDDEKSNCGDDSSDAENSTNQRDNDEEGLDPYTLENLLCVILMMS